MKACSRQDPHQCTIGAHAPTPVCAHCQAPDPVRGDGAMTLVCPRCLLALGRVADQPFSVPDTFRERLLASALDVVGIRDGRWAWTSQWPGTGDDRLISGRTA